MKVLFDLNVILDVLEDREPFVRDSATALGRVISMSRSRAYIATHAVTTAFYILRKHLGVDTARVGLRKVLDILEVLPASSKVLKSGIDADCNDYEDAVSFLAAAEAKCDYIVTRNVNDFASSPIPALTPSEFLIRTQIIPR